jgi:signal transduction histidine kinase/CheY-like chemotaxis protein
MALRTARVPPSFEGYFQDAEKVVSAYFEQIRADPTRGCIDIAGERYVLMRAASLSVEFHALVEKLYGEERLTEAHAFARNILFDLAHAVGKSDAQSFHARMRLVDPLARLSAGPIHFSHSGWAFVDISPESNPTPNSSYVLYYDHPYSFEADAWLRAGRDPGFPVCTMNAGYSSGWCEESFGLPLVATEVTCRARGDEHCRFVMAPPDQIERRLAELFAGEPSLAARASGYTVPDFFSRKRAEEELRATHRDLERRVEARTAELLRANVRLQEEMEQRRQMQQRLAQTQRLEALGRLAGGVAHDFNNLLGVILGYASSMLTRTPEEDPHHQMLSETVRAAQLAADLVRQLLTFSRAELPSRRRLDLNELVGESARMLDRMVGDDITVVCRLWPDPLFVEVDPSGIEQLLMNLAVNARDAMPIGGTLRIATSPVERDEEPGGSFVRLAVADTGVGMDEATQARIFDPFFTTKAHGEGTGLGLSTAYGIVKQAGGHISVHSEQGIGTRFDIDLPRVRGSVSRPPIDDEPSPVPGCDATVLLVEDRASVRQMVARLLEEIGCTALVASGAAQALHLAEHHPGPIDVLLTDVLMPGIDARRLAEHVVRLRPNLVVLFMSGYSNDPDLLAGPLARRAAFLAKPFSGAELDRALCGLLARR